MTYSPARSEAQLGELDHRFDIIEAVVRNPLFTDNIDVSSGQVIFDLLDSKLFKAEKPTVGIQLSCSAGSTLPGISGNEARFVFSKSWPIDRGEGYLGDDETMLIHSRALEGFGSGSVSSKVNLDRGVPITDQYGIELALPRTVADRGLSVRKPEPHARLTAQQAEAFQAFLKEKDKLFPGLGRIASLQQTLQAKKRSSEYGDIDIARSRKQAAADFIVARNFLQAAGAVSIETNSMIPLFPGDTFPRRDAEELIEDMVFIDARYSQPNSTNDMEVVREFKIESDCGFYSQQTYQNGEQAAMISRDPEVIAQLFDRVEATLQLTPELNKKAGQLFGHINGAAVRKRASFVIDAADSFWPKTKA